MKRAVLVLLLLAPPASAQQAADAIRADQIKARMFFLAGDEMAGRGLTSHESRIAAEYIASEFMRLGTPSTPWSPSNGPWRT